MIRLLLVVPLLAVLAACGPAAAAPAAQAPAQPIPTGTSCQVKDGKADRRCTPGAFNPQVTQATIRSTICTKGWTATVRPPVQYTDDLKRKQMVAYGETGSPANYEEDHFVPLELGGAPQDPANLWPQPRSGASPASQKDQEENQLRAAVCSGSMTLDVARAKIVQDWSWGQ